MGLPDSPPSRCAPRVVGPPWLFAEHGPPCNWSHRARSAIHLSRPPVKLRRLAGALFGTGEPLVPQGPFAEYALVQRHGGRGR